jgi:hypothetical protein
VVTPSFRPEQVRAGITVRRAVGVTGERGWKKRMPSGKPADRACNIAQHESHDTPVMMRTCADVQLVSFCERIWRTFGDGKANDGY